MDISLAVTVDEAMPQELPTRYAHTHFLTAIFQANLSKPEAPSVVLTGRWGCLYPTQPHSLLSNTMATQLHSLTNKRQTS